MKIKALILLGLMAGVMSMCCCGLFNWNIGSWINTLENPPIIDFEWQGVVGSGSVVEEERNVSGFTKVNFVNQGNLFIKAGEKESLRIEAQEDLLDYIETDVIDNTLRIKTRNGVDLRPTQPLNFYLTVKELDSIRLSGSGDIQSSALTAADFSVDVLGSGDIEIAALDADTLAINLDGSGKVTIDKAYTEFITAKILGSGDIRIGEGKTDRQEIHNTGSGDYKAEALVSNETEIKISGSGSSYVNTSDQLTVEILGSGSVYYSGSPSLDTNIVGSGDVEQRQ